MGKYSTYSGLLCVGVIVFGTSCALAKPGLEDALKGGANANQIDSDNRTWHDPSVAGHKVDTSGLYAYPLPKDSSVKELALPASDAKMMSDSIKLLGRRNMLQIEAQVVALQRQINGSNGGQTGSSQNVFNDHSSDLTPAQLQAQEQAKLAAQAAAAQAARVAAEAQSVPEVVEIFGTQHSWRARIMVRGGGFSWVSPGDVVGDNLRVSSINGQTVQFSSMDHQRRYMRSVSSVDSNGGIAATPLNFSQQSPVHSMATPLTP